MSKFRFLINSAVISALLNGCTPSYVGHSYAQNNYNPRSHLAPPVAVSGKSLNISLPDAAVIASSAASVGPGMIGGNALLGLSAFNLVRKIGDTTSNLPNINSILILGIPDTTPLTEEEVQVKVGEIVQNAIIKALPSGYEGKIDEYADKMGGSEYRVRWIRVNGELCANWSCQIVAPIPTKNALQWSGVVSKSRGFFHYSGTPENIGFVKIVKEYDQDSSMALSHYVIGAELLEFDYESYFANVSKYLPDYLKIHVIISTGSMTCKDYYLCEGKKCDARQTPLTNCLRI